MSRLIGYLIRFAVILFGYAVASLAASAFLNILFLASLGYMPEHANPTATASLYFSIPFVALFVAYFGFMPAVIVILLAEILGRRDWLFYALAGAVVAAVFLGLIDHAGDATFHQEHQRDPGGDRQRHRRRHLSIGSAPGAGRGAGAISTSPGRQNLERKAKYAGKEISTTRVTRGLHRRRNFPPPAPSAVTNVAR